MISPIGNKDPNYIPSHDVSQQINERRLGEADILTCINLFQPSVVFHIETSNISDWVLFEMQHLSKMS